MYHSGLEFEAVGEVLQAAVCGGGFAAQYDTAAVANTVVAEQVVKVPFEIREPQKAHHALFMWRTES